MRNAYFDPKLLDKCQDLATCKGRTLIDYQSLRDSKPINYPFLYDANYVMVSNTLQRLNLYPLSEIICGYLFEKVFLRGRVMDLSNDVKCLSSKWPRLDD